MLRAVYTRFNTLPPSLYTLGIREIALSIYIQCTSVAYYQVWWILPGAYERRVAARWSVLLVNLRFVKLANAGFLIWQHTLYYVVVG